ncbi:MAG TPA: DUF4360 domain-containing protein [Thiothrix sp.]|nr:DUF4360 domain-containing protein [Thiothrix sp.]
MSINVIINVIDNIKLYLKESIMKFKSHLKGIIASASLFALVVFPLQASAGGTPYTGAANTVYFTDVIHAGKGCPSGTLDYTITEDGKTLTILFDEYAAELDNLPRRSTKQVACNLALNIHVPSGLAVTLINAEYDGYLDLPWESTAKLMRKYFFSNSNRVRKSTKWKGAISNGYNVKDNLAAFTRNWSNCGEDTILNAHTRMVVKAPANTYAIGVVDSLNIGGKVVFHLQYGKC